MPQIHGCTAALYAGSAHAGRRRDIALMLFGRRRTGAAA